MKKAIQIFLFLLVIYPASAQDFGLSFTYFLPKNGDFSVPVTPLSIRGLGFDITSFSSIETGGTLYRMSGMNIRNLPFKSDKSLVGPFFTVFIPLELVITADFGRSIFNIKGGGFGFYNFATKLNEGNIDRALKEDLGWVLVNSDFDFDNNPGFGYLFGAEFVFYLNKKLGINIEAQYLIGGADMDLRGSYSGLPSENDSFTTVNVNYSESRLDFTGLEISLGVIITP